MNVLHNNKLMEIKNLLFFLEVRHFVCLFSAMESSIIQIAARDFKISDNIVRFFMPENGFISSAVSKLTGIDVHGLTSILTLLR